MKTILVIDDDADYREMIYDILTAADHIVEVTRCPDEAFPKLLKERFDLVICDLHMPFTLGKERRNFPYSYEVGLRTIRELTIACPDMPILAISATAPWDMKGVMVDVPNIPALSKPFAPDELLVAIERTTTRQKVETLH